MKSWLTWVIAQAAQFANKFVLFVFDGIYYNFQFMDALAKDNHKLYGYDGEEQNEVTGVRATKSIAFASFSTTHERTCPRSLRDIWSFLLALVLIQIDITVPYRVGFGTWSQPWKLFVLG